jgi:WXG100 family type VII secretion target
MGLRTGPQTAPTAAGSSSVLQTDLGTMMSASQFVHDTADRIYHQLTQLYTNIETLKGTWQSPAATAYCDGAFPDWNTHAWKVRDGLYKIADGLANSHKSYNQMEEDNVLGVRQASQAVQMP